MNNSIIDSGSATSSTGRSRALRKAALPAAAAAGAILVALGTDMPGVVAGMNLGNHNETLLRVTDDAAGPPDRGHRRWRRTATSALIAMGSLAAGVAGFGIDSTSAGDHVALIGQCGSSSGGDNEGPRGCGRPQPVIRAGCPCPGNYGTSSGGGG